jgi:manganese transport protein
VLSQVVLSFGIPFALIPLVRLTSLKSLLGESANRWWTTVLAAIAAVLLIALNATLLVLVLTGS